MLKKTTNAIKSWFLDSNGVIYLEKNENTLIQQYSFIKFNSEIVLPETEYVIKESTDEILDLVKIVEKNRIEGKYKVSDYSLEDLKRDYDRTKELLKGEKNKYTRIRLKCTELVTMKDGSKIFSDVTKVHFNCYLMWKIAKVLDGEIKVSYVDEKTAILIEGKNGIAYLMPYVVHSKKPEEVVVNDYSSF